MVTSDADIISAVSHVEDRRESCCERTLTPFRHRAPRIVERGEVQYQVTDEKKSRNLDDAESQEMDKRRELHHDEARFPTRVRASSAPSPACWRLTGGISFTTTRSGSLNFWRGGDGPDLSTVLKLPTWRARR